MDVFITVSELEKLISFQQGELDAVLMYKALAEKMKTEKEKEVLLSIAADEGRHAAILRQYTKKKLEPKSTLARLLPPLYKIMGKKRLFPIVSKFEAGTVASYEPYFKKFPEIKGIAADEARHAELLKSIM